MSDFILKSCVQLIVYLTHNMNEQEKSRLIQILTSPLRFGVVNLTFAAGWIGLCWRLPEIITALRWW